MQNSVPGYLPQQPATVQAKNEETSSSPQDVVEETVSLQTVLKHEAKWQHLATELGMAEESLRVCQREIKEKYTAIEELKSLKNRSFSPSVVRAYRVFLGIVGLAPGWILADATVGVLGVLVFCPLTVKGALKLADLLGFQLYRSKEVLLHARRRGDAAESQIAKHQKKVTQIGKLHTSALVTAENSRSSYEAEIQRTEEAKRRQQEQAEEARRRQQEQDEKRGRSPQPTDLPSTKLLDTSQTRVLGKGGEWVYAYSFPSQIRGDLFPIKVGMTSRSDVVKRLEEQMTGTSMPEQARILLLFKVPNGMRAEKAFHRELKDRGRHMREAVGTEWFRTNQEELIELYWDLEPI